MTTFKTAPRKQNGNWIIFESKKNYTTANEVWGGGILESPCLCLSVDKNLSGLSLETTRGIYLKFSTNVNYHIKLCTWYFQFDQIIFNDFTGELLQTLTTVFA